MHQNLAVSIIMMVVAGFFTLCAVLSLFLLKRVSRGVATHTSAGLPCVSLVMLPGSPEFSGFPQGRLGFLANLWGPELGLGCHKLTSALPSQVHSLYRRTGASFQQAQEEFSHGIFSNRTFRSAATSAAQGTFRGN